MILVFSAFKSKKISFLLLLATVVLLLFFIYEEALSRHLYGVNQEVFFLNKNMSGLFEEEVKQVIQTASLKFNTDPVSAVVKKNTRNEIIPHLLGHKINKDLTLKKIMQAEYGETIEPVFEDILPPVTLQDFPNLPVYRGNPIKNEIALMINVAWGEEYIPQMLQVLQENKVKSTFFLTGRWVEKNQDIVLAILEEGHEIATHGYCDRIVLQGLTKEETISDLEDGIKVIKKIIPHKIRYFTPHKGEFDTITLEATATTGLRMIMWSLDTADWMKPGVEKMLARTVEKVFNGAIVLMHPTEETVLYLREALPLFQKRGLKLVTISALLSPEQRIVSSEESGY